MKRDLLGTVPLLVYISNNFLHMFTFLPKTNRVELEKEYRKRVVVVALGLVALLMLIAMILAMPAFVTLLVKGKDARAALKGNPDTDVSSNALMEARVTDIRAKTDLLKQMVDVPSLVSVIERINGRLVNGISLNSITLKRSGTGSIVISGIASTRDALVAFSKSLQGELSFSNISLPVSTLAKSKDIAFSISVDSHF